MLNPPLSLLSDDLLVSIVEEVAKLPYADEFLNNLSLADRAFTQSCQKYIFRMVILGSRMKISKQLAKKKKFLDDKPSIIDRVRMVQLRITVNANATLFKDPNFTSILQLFAKSPVPPHELHLNGLFTSTIITIEDPLLLMRQLTESFFSQTLTILHVSGCANVPLPLFLICPRLREVFLYRVGATDKSYDKYPDDQCSGREAPLLEVFDCCNSHTLIEQMIAPPSRFNTPVVLWSNLRVLTLAPYDKEGMACLQPILDAACNTLEELYLTNKHLGDFQQISLTGLVNLSNLSNLQVFSLYSVLNCELPGKRARRTWKAPTFAVLRDVNMVLGTIPGSNRITNLSFDFIILGRHPYPGCLDQDWVGMFNEVIRIGDGKPLELELQIETGYMGNEYIGQDELYMRIMENAASLSGYPKICTHWWNPILESRGLGRFTCGQVRRRCRR